MERDNKMKKWYNVELKEPDTSRFQLFLRALNVEFEPSGAGYGYTHFEVLLDDRSQEFARVNDFLGTL